VSAALLAATLLCVIGDRAALAAPLPVVATFSILGDIVKNVGGERVAVETLVDANTSPHTYTPTPQDAKQIAAARLIVVNGLGFDDWAARLIESGRKARVVVASERVDAIVRAGTADPHAWQNVANMAIYVTNIREALVAIDPDGLPDYASNAQRYLASLQQLDGDIKAALGALPAAKKAALTPHAGFDYFASAYGVRFVALQGGAEAELSARDYVAVLARMKREKIGVVLFETAAARRVLQQIATESSAQLAGPLFADSLTGPAGEAPSYVAMMRHNLRLIANAMQQSPVSAD
jgi:zinc/manganese transport system substrate-binding protein